MGVLEALVEGVFGLLRIVVVVAIMLYVFSVLAPRWNRKFGGEWGRPTGTLPAFSLRRLRCKHVVCWQGAGTNGLWAWWCDACGKKRGGR